MKPFTVRAWKGELLGTVKATDIDAALHIARIQWNDRGVTVDESPPTPKAKPVVRWLTTKGT